ncbi:3-oxoacyl-ACP reductase [Saccharobesus litoralis]|uniref:3-oxoacyl-ACP reductase n=1 Tax=Saccharobesus litoralis TaxID=2172099 RepID=A0A2S0VNB3_9ALTE|nr:glucose 1-dehydrogenase [Saccharobesus litoralis]AWB65703.1 3-oxoacyl-ACP reductase [Saccharobesus litoralis]
MAQSTNKQVIVISGGSRGLGRGIAEQLMASGHAVATFSRSKTDFVETAQAANPDNFFWAPLDITDAEALKLFVNQVYQKFGRIDGLVNNAGATLDALLPITTDEEMERTLALNLTSSMRLSRLVSRVMLRQQSGSIINISSVLGVRGFKGVSVYGATKAALDGFSRSLARELGSKKIRVNSIAPGFLATDMTHGMAQARKEQIERRTPLGRLGEVEDVAGVVEFMLSDAARFVTGQTIVIDGGLTC